MKYFLIISTCLLSLTAAISACTSNAQQGDIAPTTLVPPRPSKPPAKQVREAQFYLTVLDFSVDNKEGQLTAQTLQALQQYQQQNQLPISNILTPATFKHLQQAVKNWTAFQLDFLGYQTLHQFQQKAQLPLTKQLNTATYRAIKQAVSALENHSTSLNSPNSPSTNPVTEESALATTTHSSTITITAQGIDALKQPKLYELAAYLKNIGYLHGELAASSRQTVHTALADFQKQIQSPQGIINDATWQRLKSVQLSQAIQAELDSLLQPTKPPMQTAKPAHLHSPEDPIFPTFTLKPGDNIFALETVECKNQHQAWLTFYEGKIESIDNDKVNTHLKKRYALWYDRRKTGIFEGDWWCIPRQRFCYAPVKFTDWAGQQQAGDAHRFAKNMIIPTTTTLGRDHGIAALTAHITTRQCPFSPTTASKKKP